MKLALYARRREVEIMQLVGASETLIQAPFVLEGMLQVTMQASEQAAVRLDGDVRLVRGGEAVAPIWSPDGRSIFFSWLAG